MKTRSIGAGLAVALAAAGGYLAAQEAGGQEGPRPGKEHEFLRQFEGKWDIAGKFWMAPGQPPTECKGSGTYAVSLGGFWMIFDERYEAGPMSFQGHGVSGYDTDKKKYVSVWFDSMSTWPLVMYGDLNAGGKSMTMTGETKDPHTGEMLKMRMVHDFKDKDVTVLTAYMSGKDGKEGKAFEVTYTRKK